MVKNIYLGQDYAGVIKIFIESIDLCDVEFIKKKANMHVDFALALKKNGLYNEALSLLIEAKGKHLSIDVIQRDRMKIHFINNQINSIRTYMK